MSVVEAGGSFSHVLSGDRNLHVRLQQKHTMHTMCCTSGAITPRVWRKYTYTPDKNKHSPLWTKWHHCSTLKASDIMCNYSNRQPALLHARFVAPSISIPLFCEWPPFVVPLWCVFSFSVKHEWNPMSSSGAIFKKNVDLAHFCGQRGLAFWVTRDKLHFQNEWRTFIVFFFGERSPSMTGWHFLGVIVNNLSMELLDSLKDISSLQSLLLC